MRHNVVNCEINILIAEKCWSANQSLALFSCNTCFLTKSFAMAEFRRLLHLLLIVSCHMFVSVRTLPDLLICKYQVGQKWPSSNEKACTLHLLNCIAISFGKAKLDHNKVDLVTSRFG